MRVLTRCVADVSGLRSPQHNRHTSAGNPRASRPKSFERPRVLRYAALAGRAL